MSESDFEHEQEDLAAEEAAAIGGQVSYDPPAGEEELDPAQAPLVEAGEGESEGFELTEQELIQHASHGDEQTPARIIYDAVSDEEPDPGVYGEADEEHQID